MQYKFYIYLLYKHLRYHQFYQHITDETDQNIWYKLFCKFLEVKFELLQPINAGADHASCQRYSLQENRFISSIGQHQYFYSVDLNTYTYRYQEQMSSQMIGFNLDLNKKDNALFSLNTRETIE